MRPAGCARPGQVMGLLQQDAQDWFRGGTDDVAAIEAAIAERLAARKARDFARADAIRAEWAAKGIAFEDGPQGTTWRRVKLRGHGDAALVSAWRRAAAGVVTGVCTADAGMQMGTPSPTSRRPPRAIAMR